MNCPHLIEEAETDDLAAICYSLLEDSRPRETNGTSEATGETSTLSDFIIRHKTPLEQIDPLVSRCLQMCAPQGIVVGDDADMLLRYTNRFHRLKSEQNLANAYKRATERLLSLGVLIDHSPDYKLASTQMHVARSSKMCSDERAAFESHLVGTVHGDLHGDNILLLNKGSAVEPYYIDFANSGRHHVALDFIVMEVGFRFQLLRHCALFITLESSPRIWQYLLHSELDLAAEAQGRPRIPIEQSPDIGSDEFSIFRVYHAIRTVRRAFALLVAARCDDPSDFAERGHWEDEQARYYCGVSLACLACLSLPTDERVIDLQENLMVLGAGLYASAFNAAAKGKDHGQKLFSRLSISNHLQLINR